MNKINTPFGEIDLESSAIEFEIKNSSIGSIRKVAFDGIHAMSEEKQYAFIAWKIWQYDSDENLKNELDAVQGRVVITPVSGSNKVTDEGVLIIRELFTEGKSGDEEFTIALSQGHNEYKYWMGLLRIVPLTTVITAAGQLLEKFQRFDRE
jgi:hypothetical protein